MSLPNPVTPSRNEADAWRTLAAQRYEDGRKAGRAEALAELGALSSGDSARLLEHLDNPPEPTQALREAVARAKAVQRPEAPDVTAAREEGRQEGRAAALAEVADHLEIAAWVCASAVPALRRGEGAVAVVVAALALQGHAANVGVGRLLRMAPDGKVTGPGLGAGVTVEAAGRAAEHALKAAMESP